ncbi:MAG: aminoglycoside phosphotransferase family protein [Candidatus Zambryskibacteria bacterium]|nr:aminoglycoside phosphotransferase family protein [Candidatus Zambryskibacteria bacterium]
MEENIKKYFNKQGLGGVLKIEELADGSSNNHLNYKIKTAQGVFVARIKKSGDLLSYSNLADEYTILKLIEKYNIGPKVFRVDLENFNTPILIEEFIEGKMFTDVQDASEEMFEKSLNVLVETSKINIGFDEFPFKSTYQTYQVHSKVWAMCLDDIEKSLGSDYFIINKFKAVIKSAQDILEKKEGLLEAVPKEFIYNDIHPGNIFWVPAENRIKFIDWQKVSLGDPVFMVALFARRFGHLWKMESKEFAAKVLNFYKSKKEIENIEELFFARILERAVSDMIWSVWADIKRGVPIKITNIDENKYFSEVKELILEM